MRNISLINIYKQNISKLFIDLSNIFKLNTLFYGTSDIPHNTYFYEKRVRRVDDHHR